MADGDNQNSANGKADNLLKMSERGVAPIKPEYVTTKEKFHAYFDDEDAVATSTDDCNFTLDDCVAAEPPTKKVKLDDFTVDQDDQGEKITEGEAEKKRARGQNKSRPHRKYSHYEQQKLCPSIIQECASKCYFGEKCKFLHDAEKYLALKQTDIGPKCYLYETFGKCMYGLKCRFARSHLGDNFKNLMNEEAVKKWEGKVLVKNLVSKDLQVQLRKRKVSFEKAEQFLIKSQQEADGDLVPPSAPKSGPKEGGGGGSASTDLSAVKEEPAKDCVKTSGALTDEDIVKLKPCEKKKVEFRDKLYLAPLTTCGNLPFRRICKRFGADITCGEMAMCTNLLQGNSSEWALVKRHHTEDIFGVQLEGAFPDTLTKCAELLNRTIDADFVDLNVGCPIDLVYNKGGGCGLMTRVSKFENIVKGMKTVLDVPVTVKIRTGVQEKNNLAHKLIPQLKDWGVSMITLHGRSREQRYTRLADWDYIGQCAKIAEPLPLFGNGDIFSFEDANRAMKTGVSGIMLARGALVKPWLFTEIKEQRNWDISSSERFDILQEYANYGLEHWGSDTEGVEKTRRFMLEWLSFLCRYIPVGLLERLPQKINERPPYYLGRDYKETLMASQNVGDWIKISEMFLGPVPQNFTFLPKHKANSYK